MIPDRERFTGSLFERLEKQTSGYLRSPHVETLRDSIRQSLRNILNTRSGSCRGTPELGLDEPESSENYQQAMSQTIARCIERYEPRISQVSVQAGTPEINSPQNMTFHITAWVTFNSQNEILEFDMAPNGSQHYRVD